MPTSASNNRASVRLLAPEATRLAGLTQTGGYLLGGILPWITGLLIDQLGVAPALLTLLIGSAGFLAVITVAIQRIYQK